MARGISLLDLVAPVPGAQAVLPDGLARTLETFAVHDHATSHSATTFVHTGVVRPVLGALVDDLTLPGLDGLVIELPGITTGIPFRLTRMRTPLSPTDTLEPAATDTVLDLVVDRLAIVFPGLQPAVRVEPGPGSATVPHLVRDPDRRVVKVVGSGVVRVDLTGTTAITRLVDHPDPFDLVIGTRGAPGAAGGNTGRFTFEPPHFFLGGSQWGMTVDRITYDGDETFTPTEIVDRGHDATWRGVAIAEASLFFPPNAPLVEDLVLGVRDVLLGRPAGLQGEVRVDLGRSPVSPDLVAFLQDVPDPLDPDEVTTSTLATTGSGRNLTVALVDDAGPAGRVRAELPDAVAGLPSAPRMTFTLPDDTTVEGLATPTFDVRHGEHLRAVPSELADPTDPDSRVEAAALSWTFAESTGDAQHAPAIRVEAFPGAPGDPTRFDAVLHVSGTWQDLTGLRFVALASDATDPTTGWLAIEDDDPDASVSPWDADALTWHLDDGIGAGTHVGAAWKPPIPPDTGDHHLTLTDDDGHVRRLRVTVLDVGALVVGTIDGPKDLDGDAIDVRDLVGTHPLGTFHRDGLLASWPQDPASVTGGVVSVPDGALAEVSLELGTIDDPDAPADDVPLDTEVRHVQVEFAFNDGEEELRWGPARPNAATGAFAESQVADWADRFAGADLQFLVIGRCCDIGTQQRNEDLAGLRATEGARWLGGRDVVARGEQDTPSAEISTRQDAAGVTGQAADAVWLARAVEPWEQWPTDDTNAPPERPGYRRVDVYAIGGTVVQDGDTTAIEADESARRGVQLRRVLVPGADLDLPATPGVREPSLAFLVSLVVGWDSPTLVEPGDWIPTLAELTVEWASRDVTMPAGGDVRPESPGAGTSEVFTLSGAWTHDARTGATRFALGLSSSGDPEGLALIDSDLLATTLALAPALLAGLDAAGVVDDRAQLSAMILAGVAIHQVAKDGRTVLHGFELVQEQAALGQLGASTTTLLLDYTVAVGFEVDAAGLGSIATDDGRPLKVRHTGVGVAYDDRVRADGGAWSDGVSLVYADAEFAVEDPGRWQVDGPLGNLLRVTATRSGTGSSWFEVDLAFALDLGVITLTEATLRVTFADDGSIRGELRGLGAHVEIPGVLIGSGRVAVQDGVIRAGLEVDVVAMNVIGAGSLAVDPSVGFVAIQAAVVLPVGIPLASSGLGLYGFSGRFVANGARDLTGLSTDPVQREIDWYRRADEDKFSPEPGQWALGLGTIVGTLPDTGFTFNATGMFVVAFPDPLVVFGIDAKLLARPSTTPSESAPPPSSLTILGLVTVDPTAVNIGVRAEYELPKVLELDLPLSAHFPLPANPDPNAAWFLRIGADGVNGRLGDPVALTLLPGTLDARAWSYLMVEQRELHDLGGDDRFDFDGFSVGFGAGWEIDWRAGPIRLSASASVLVGLGTDPFLLKGGVFVAGELSLKVVSISARGEIIATVWDDAGELRVNLSGQFCGSVDLFFFELEGCVGVEIGHPLDPEAPTPPHPVTDVRLVDRRGFVVAEASTTNLAGTDHTVWPDTIPVIGFSAWMDTALAADSAFLPAPPAAGERWSGTSELKYAYRLTSIELAPVGGDPLEGPLDSAWWLPTDRPGVLELGDAAPSEHEGRTLALLSWDPAPWVRALGDHAPPPDGDPATTLERVCDETATPVRSCVHGVDASRTGPSSLRLPDSGDGVAPFVSRFDLLATEVLADRPLHAGVPLTPSMGLEVVPGHVVAGPRVLGEVPPVSDVDLAVGPGRWQLAELHANGRRLSTVGLDGIFAGPVVAPEVLLWVCRTTRDDPLEGDGPDRPLDPRDECLDLDRFEPDESFTRRVEGVFKIAARGGRDLTVHDDGGTRSIHFFDDGMRVVLSRGARRVRAIVSSGTSERIGLRAFDAAGDVLDTDVSAGSQGPGQKLVVRTPDERPIVAVELRGGGGEARLQSLCADGLDVTGLPEPGEAARALVGELPVVASSDEHGELRAWRDVTILDEALLPDEHAGRRRCALVRYRPERDHASERDFTDARILPWLRGSIGFVRACGTTVHAMVLADDDAAARAGHRDGLGRRAEDGLAFREDLLAADTLYELRIGWAWQGWVKSDDAPTPPPVPAALDAAGNDAWLDGGVVTRRFRTAARVHDDPEPVDERDESVFDPRGIVRYLLGFDPDGAWSDPHLLDDPVLVHLAVDHAETLCDRYDLDLVLEARRTDPPAGAAAAGGNEILDLTVTSLVLFDAFRRAGEQRTIDAVRDLDCVETPAMGGETLALDLPLEPRAEYDLVLLTRPRGTGDDVVVARAHFRTSRYRVVDELVVALGFTADAHPILAADAILDSAAPDAPGAPGPDELRDDGAFEATLVDLGMDPWPVVVGTCRTTTIWRHDDPGDTTSAARGWRLVGVLLETDEALLRPVPRETVIPGLEVEGTTGKVVLGPVRANASGTRVLLAAAAAVELAGDDDMLLGVDVVTTIEGDLTSTRQVLGSRRLLATPRTVHQEVGP